MSFARQKFCARVTKKALRIPYCSAPTPNALVVANAPAYSKLCGTTRPKPVYDDADVLAMGTRLSAYTSHFPSGPLVVVGHDDAVVLAFERFVDISSPKRPAAILKTGKKARAWLATQSAA